MATHGESHMSKFRVQAPVSDQARLQLQALADARKCSLGAVCGELLEQAAPVAAQIAEALEVAKFAPARAMREVLDLAQSHMAAVDQFALDLVPGAVEDLKTG